MEEMGVEVEASTLRAADHNAAEFCAPDAAVRAEAWRELRERCPVARSESYGGYWILSDYTSVAEALRNSDVFSHRYDPHAEDGIDYIGVNGFPRMDWPALA